jgi:transposase
VAWGAARSKGTYLGTTYHRLAARRGKKRAILGVAHTILVIGYHLIERVHQARLERYLVRRLESLGHRVILQPAEP